MAVRLGTLLDRLYKAKLDKDRIAEELKKANARYNAIETVIFDSFKKTELEGAMGKLAIATLSRPKHPTLKSAKKLYAFIYANKAADLLQLRVAKGNWEDRMEARNNRPIPGITTYQQTKLSLRKKG